MATRSGETVDLGIGEPDFPTPQHIREAGKRAIDEGYTRYTPQPGFQDLREAIARKFAVENQLQVPPDQVVVFCGAKYAVYEVLQCLLRPGDEVLILAPYWYAYPAQVELAQGMPVIVRAPEERAFHPDIDAIRAAVTKATKAIVINSPCNPTGAVYGRDELSRLADLALERDLWVIADEVYERIVFDSAEHVSIGSLNEEIAQRTITVNSVSKTHSMTGWRIGYAAMPPELAEAVIRLQGHSTSGPCAIAQRAALAALTEDASHVQAMVAEYARRRAYLLERLDRLDAFSCHPPEGTFYVLLNVAGLRNQPVAGSRIDSGADFARLLHDQAGVNVVPAAGFGAAWHVRLSFASSMDSLQEGMDRIERLTGC